MYIDTHTHFDLCMEGGGAREEDLVAGLKSSNIKFAVQISTDTSGLEWSYNFAKRNDGIFFTLGIHPSSRAADDDLSALASYAERITASPDSGLLFGIGETGLDFYRMRQPKEAQFKSFEYQIGIAKKHCLPLVVHSRDAFDDTIKILSREKPAAGIMHCFPGTKDMARMALDLGFYISFAGNLTYNKAADLHDAASYIPRDRLLVETDAPFLTPVPHRGKRNRSEYIIHTYKFLSELRKQPLEELEEAVYNNFLALTKRPQT